MKYMVTFPLTTDRYTERVKKFLETGGAPPPEGVSMIGRWFTLAHDRGFIVMETEDPKPLFRWVSEWADMIDFEVLPVLSDEEAGGVLQSMPEFS